MFDFLDIYPWILPFFIFFGRICDVSLGTLRIILVSKGSRRLAPAIGFLEVFIWILIISQILARANDMVSYLSYAAGYATGTYIGLVVEEKIGLGYVIYRVFTMKNGLELNAALKGGGFGSSVIHGEGSVSKVDIVEVVISRKQVRPVEKIINDFDSDAFYTVEDVRAKQRGVFNSRRACSVRK
ncbi:MAG: DUF5698 domain-containing protein [Deltaproteobacteria bacterium]|jgi:uncharacterized protein YebE (UPF0316 family)|nr:DUF5698 domain-containing protein [Deltaproteobacteria bacterium]